MRGSAIASMLLVLSGCRPPDCETPQCAHDEYMQARHCNAVLEASVIIVGNTRLPSSAKYDAGAIRSLLIEDMDYTLASGMKLGMSRNAVYTDLEQAKAEYLGAYAARRGDSRQKLRGLFNDVNDCLPHNDPYS
jgi:hypothetical protein